MDGFPIFMLILLIALLLIFRVWNGFCGFLGVDREIRDNVMACAFSVILMFCVGFGLRLSKDDAIVDIGYFLTDLSFLLTYLLIGFAALLGQVRYHRGPSR